MKMRKKLSRRASKRNFRRGGKVKAKNMVMALRGGYRL